MDWKFSTALGGIGKCQEEEVVGLTLSLKGMCKGYPGRVGAFRPCLGSLRVCRIWLGMIHPIPHELSQRHLIIN